MNRLSKLGCSITLLAAGLAACSETPELPYNGGDDNDSTETTVKSLPYSESFSSSFGSFTTYSASGDAAWAIDYSTAKMTGYVDKVNLANEDWLISPQIKLENVTNAKVGFEYIARYFSDLANDLTVWASTDYDGKEVSTATWTRLAGTLVSGADWTNFASIEYDLSKYVNQTVTIAIKYLSTDAKAGTIELKNLIVQEGKVAGEDPGQDGVKSLPYSESFASTLGSFTAESVTGDATWVIDFSTAKMTGYVNPNYFENEDWLISPQISLQGVSAARVGFSYIARYFTNVNDEVTVWVSTTYKAGDKLANGGWEQLIGTLTEGADWNNFASIEYSLTKYVGSTVTIAIKYLSTNTKAGTMEIKDLTVQDGEAGTGGGDGPSGETIGDANALNGDFENWTNGQPNQWKSTTTASSATLILSKEAHGGSYSVEVVGTTSNKRIAYKELTLAAGDYKMAFYAKSADASALGSVRPGYAPYDAATEKLGTYAYGEYTNSLSATEWSLIEHSFTLEAETQINVLVMVPKNTGNVLIDDFTLTAADGTVLIK